MKIIKERSLYA